MIIIVTFLSVAEVYTFILFLICVNYSCLLFQGLLYVQHRPLAFNVEKQQIRP